MGAEERTMTSHRRIETGLDFDRYVGDITFFAFTRFIGSLELGSRDL